ncbi:hypothetical protein GCM10008957_54820 [Deinococcus ruber]|uniref:Uncharacterized protein n=1 Tax=Deinococcus ruber TaxID=1848197 RepID=A0A918FI03_9DEIO|nr:hypothetical protein GCM10008957_54820 [Deinococcus ruber]
MQPDWLGSRQSRTVNDEEWHRLKQAIRDDYAATLTDLSQLRCATMTPSVMR